MKVVERLFELQELEMGPQAEAAENRRAAENLRKEIPDPILGHYDRLRARGKKGVALVRHGVCTGCQMKLASGPFAALRRDDDIAMCDNCARYLLLCPEPAAPAANPAAPASKKPAAKRGRPKAKPALVE
ncbi:MAG: hypothetical protein FJ387_05945 [Verrucomicrobia bacterium]|nr:hypothetical protein [Verrucomicrobiota bacterium]